MTADFKPLAGRNVLITGASSGVGRHFALLLARHGARIACCARRVALLEDVVEQIVAQGGEALAIACDVADGASIANAFDEAQAAFGPIDSVICNAGVQSAGPSLKLTEQDFDMILSVNLRGLFLTAREGARRMSAAPENQRRVILVSSVLGTRPLAGAAAYSATKSAANMLAKSLALEWARRRITVNAICPGYMETEIQDDWFETAGGKADIARWPLQRFMNLDQLDAPLLFLLSEGATATTGNALMVDEAQSLG